MFCPSCGFKIESNQNFCPNCGHSFENWNEPSPSSQTFIGRNKGKFYLLFLITFFLTVWGFYSALHSGNKLEELTNSQLSEIKKKQLTKAYYEYASSQFKKSTSLEDFKKLIESNRVFNEFSKVSFHDSQQDTNYGVVYADLFMFDDLKVPSKFEFIKEDGEWKVLRFELEQPQIVLNEKNSHNDELTLTIKSQLDAIKNKEIEKAYEEFNSEEFKSATNPELFAAFIKHYPQFLNFNEITLTQIDKNKDKGKVDLILYADKEALPLEYSLIKKDGKWKIWSIQILEQQNHQPHFSEETKDYLAKPIQSFLKDLKEEDLKKAYEETSPNFKKSTTFEVFKNFIQRFPGLKSNDIKFTNSLEEKDLSLVRLKSKEIKDIDSVEFTLAKENGAWKILGIEMIQNQTAKPIDDKSHFDDQFLKDVIEKQLEKIRNKNYQEAYDNFTSKEFKKITPLESFISFIEGNSIFANNDSGKFGDLMVDNNVATLKGILSSKSGERGYVEYDLIKEDNLWKILGIRILVILEEKNNPSKEKKELI